MKTWYYFIKWLFKDFKVGLIECFFFSASIVLVGMLINLYAVSHRIPVDKYITEPDPFYQNLSSYFIWTGSAGMIAISFVGGVIFPLRDAFKRFKQEQKDLLTKISNGR